MADDDNPPTARRGRSTIVRPPSRTLSNVSAQRRQSASARINEILETARERADTMNSGSVSPQSPGSPASRQPLFPSQATTIEEEGSADETTGIATRGPGPSYQTLNTGDGSVRSRKSIYSRQSQPSSQPSSQQDLELWGRDRGSHDTAPNGSADAQPEAQRSWLSRTLASFRSVELENKGSVARDHLALERTFLAWLRTSLAFASIGIAVTQLFRLNTSLPSSGDDTSAPLRHAGKPLGATFLAISILILLLGYRRYFQAQEWVMKGKFPASRGTIIVVSLVALAIMAVSLVVVIVIQPTNSDDL